MLVRYIALIVAMVIAPAQQAFKIAKIDTTGATRLSAADVAKVSGLAIGQRVTPADLDAAVTRMAECGLFKEVSYRFTTADGQITVDFTVSEQPWDTPVVLDNFVGIPDDELSKAIRAEVPTYDGIAPPTGIPPLISHALAGVLKAHGRTGTIDYKGLANLDGSHRMSVFSVQPGPPLCALHVDGAVQVPEAEVVLVAKSLMGVDYSRHQLEKLTRTSLPQPFYEHGYWKAALTVPTATLGASGTCQGVLAAVHVDEGAVYRWDRAEWTGTTAVAPKDLESVVALKPGDVAESLKIDAGLHALEKLEHRLGYLNEKATVEPVLDDAAHTALFKVAIVEGPQFPMGTVTFLGVSPKDASTLAGLWKLKTGDPFDDYYPGEFRLAATKVVPAARTLEMSATADPATHIVTLRFAPK